MFRRKIAALLTTVSLAVPCAFSTGCCQGFPSPIERGDSVPVMPWPPPAPSARDALSRDLMLGSRSGARVGDVADHLVHSLDRRGYSDKAWYWVPNGFALVTHLEQIDNEGKPRPPPDRWSSEFPKPRFFSLDNVLYLLRGGQGRYRVLVFVVTDRPFQPGPYSAAAGPDWINGPIALPPEIAELPLTPGHQCVTLVYEFVRKGAAEPVTFVESSVLSGREHLAATGLLDALRTP